MNFEGNINEAVDEKIKFAKKNATSTEEANRLSNLESEAISGFIKGEYDLAKFREFVRAFPIREGRVYFDTLPELIAAVRQIVPMEKQNQVLDHENAHALAAQERGYNFKYGLEYVKDE